MAKHLGDFGIAVPFDKLISIREFVLAKIDKTAFADQDPKV